MRIIHILAALCVLLCLTLSAQAQGLFFAQDDFVLIYGQPNSPGAAGAQITMDGRLVNWSQNTVAAWFTLSGSNANNAYVVGNEYRTDYDTNVVLKITTMPNGAGALLWEGNGSAYTLVHADQSGYNAASFDRPGWYNPLIVSSGYVTEYQSVGAGSFNRAGGPWTNSQFVVDWFGSYDWNFITDGQGNGIGSTGNLQGKIDVVPEPSGVLACMTGLIGCAGLIRRRRS